MYLLINQSNILLAGKWVGNWGAFISAVYGTTPETNLFEDADWNSLRTTSC